MLALHKYIRSGDTNKTEDYIVRKIKYREDYNKVLKNRESMQRVKIIILY